jgi:lipopolysaccharide heptosyltransferase II
MNDLVKPKRILIYQVNWLGDILFSFPLLRAIRKKFPEAYITCVVVPRYIDLLVNNPWVNDIHALSDNNNLLYLHEKFSFIRMIYNEHYDMSISLKASRSKAIMSKLSGISERIGFAGKKAHFTKEVEIPEARIHRADMFLALSGVLGVEEADPEYEYFVSDIDREKANKVLHEVGGGTRPIITMNPGGNWDLKRWPLANYIKLAKMIMKEFKNHEIMITGAKKDMVIAREIVSEIKDERCYSVAGKTGLNDLAVLFKRSELVVSADSGPLHLASAIGATTIGLFGPTHPEITGPRGKGRNIVIFKDVDCRIPCYETICPKNLDCMKEITPDEVLETVKYILLNKNEK